MKVLRKYKFSDKNETLGGVISTVMGILSLVSLAYGVYVSFRVGGEAGVKVGVLGLASLLLALIGTIIGFLSFKEGDKFYTFSRIGTFMCGIITVFMIAVFLMGVM